MGKAFEITADCQFENATQAFNAGMRKAEKNFILLANW
jgi:hypothetical protein